MPRGVSQSRHLSAECQQRQAFVAHARITIIGHATSALRASLPVSDEPTIRERAASDSVHHEQRLSAMVTFLCSSQAIKRGVLLPKVRAGAAFEAVIAMRVTRRERRQL